MSRVGPRKVDIVRPFVVIGDNTVQATGASCTFGAPSQMPQVLYCVWVTYTDWHGVVQLLESWYLEGEPVAFGPGGPAFIVNLGFQDYAF